MTGTVLTAAARLLAPTSKWRMPTAVLGDVHGDYERMLQLVGDLDPSIHLVLVGDYFDRWDRGLDAVRWIMSRPNTTALMGNHDALMLGVLEEVEAGDRGDA